jgi:zinc protease
MHPPSLEIPSERHAGFVKAVLRVLAACTLALLCLAAGAPAGRAAQTASGAAADVLRATLQNGLQVVIVRNRLAPVVTTVVNYKVGADETPKGFPGMAHAQEHMMFRGTTGLSGDALAYLSAVMGGNFDAQTRQTVTQYYFTVPAEDLDVALHIEASRMRGALDAEKDWRQERKAIEQEVAQDLSSPRYLLYAKLRAALFAGTPYAHDALGTKPSFDRTTGRMLKAFYDTWYAPNNAVLVVAGNLDPAATLDKIKSLFGDLKPKKLPARPKIALRALKAQSFHLDTDLSYGLTVLAFRMPGIDSRDRYAAEILADVLSSQRGELFGLVPQGKALDAGFSMEELPHAGLGYATVAYPSGSDPASLQKEVRAILAKIARDGVPPDLVEAAKRQERRGLEFQKNSIADLAAAWSEAVAVDGLASPEAELAELDKVTVADVNNVARRYLDLDHAVSAVLTPRGSGKPVASRGFGGRESISLGEAKPTRLPAWAKQAVARLSVPPSTVHPTVSKLSNGITLIVQPESISDTVSIYGRIKNRPELQVPAGQEGLSQVLDELLGYGTVTLDRIAFQKALDDIGADVEAGTDFSLRVLADQLDRGVELLADNELHPRLPADAFEVVKRQVAQSVAGRLESPDYLAGRALRAALFPKNDPEQREALPKTVGAITLADVRAYYRAAFRPDLTTIVVIGKITPEQAKAVIEKYFGAWKAEGPQPDTLLPAVPASGPSTTAVPDASRVQDRVTLAETLGLTRSNPDYYALQLGNHVLGGAFYSTRLYRDLRKNTGLVYFVGTALELGKTRGLYFVEYACDPKNVSRVHRIVEREITDMQTRPVSAEELQQAKAQLLREIPLGESDVDSIARGFLARSLLDLPLDEPTLAAHRYLALGAAEIQAAFKKWLRPADFALVSQGPAPR